MGNTSTEKAKELVRLSREYIEDYTLTTNILIVVVAIVVSWVLFHFILYATGKWKSEELLFLTNLLLLVMFLVLPYIQYSVVEHLLGQGGNRTTWESKKSSYIKELEGGIENKKDLHIDSRDKDNIIYYIEDKNGKRLTLLNADTYLEEHKLNFKESKKYSVYVYYSPTRIVDPYDYYTTIEDGWYIKKVKEK